MRHLDRIRHAKEDKSKTGSLWNVEGEARVAFFNNWQKTVGRCPICNNLPEVREEEARWITFWYAGCQQCGIFTSPQIHAEDAAEAWNKICNLIEQRREYMDISPLFKEASIAQKGKEES